MRSWLRESLNNNTNRPVAAIVAAADSGSQFGASVSRALARLGGMSLVCRSVLAIRSGGMGHVVATTPEGCLPIFEATLSGLDGITYTVGETKRQDSIKLGLDVLSEHFGPETIVLIHDVARLLIPPQAVTAVLRAMAYGAKAAIPVVAVHDSIRQIGDDGSRIIDRPTLRAIQIPQGARLGLSREAHEHVIRHGLVITNDASTIEALGHRMMLVPGYYDALKVIEQSDLVLAQGILDGRSQI